MGLCYDCLMKAQYQLRPDGIIGWPWTDMRTRYPTQQERMQSARDGAIKSGVCDRCGKDVSQPRPVVHMRSPRVLRTPNKIDELKDWNFTQKVVGNDWILRAYNPKRGLTFSMKVNRNQTFTDKIMLREPKDRLIVARRKIMNRVIEASEKSIWTKENPKEWKRSSTVDDIFSEMKEQFEEPLGFKCPVCGGTLWDGSNGGTHSENGIVGWYHSESTVPRCPFQDINNYVRASTQNTDGDELFSMRYNIPNGIKETDVKKWYDDNQFISTPCAFRGKECLMDALLGIEIGNEENPNQLDGLYKGIMSIPMITLRDEPMKRQTAYCKNCKNKHCSLPVIWREYYTNPLETTDWQHLKEEFIEGGCSLCGCEEPEPDITSLRPKSLPTANPKISTCSEEKAGVEKSPRALETTKEVIDIMDEFKDFDVVDCDKDFVYLRKQGLGVVEGRILRGSLGSYDLMFVVEKFGERNKLFSGKNVIKRIKKYLELE